MYILEQIVKYPIPLQDPINQDAENIYGSSIKHTKYFKKIWRDPLMYSYVNCLQNSTSNIHSDPFIFLSLKQWIYLFFMYKSHPSVGNIKERN